MSEIKATAKGLHTSARKMGLVAALVRGRSVNDSLTILEHTHRGAAPMLAQVVKSAAANAKVAKANVDDMRIASLYVSPGSTAKRFRPASRGMVHPLRHRTAHVTVILDEAAESTNTVRKK